MFRLVRRVVRTAAVRIVAATATAIEISRALFIGIAKCTKRDLLFIYNININIRETHRMDYIFDD
jgi:hypothetical protein